MLMVEETCYITSSNVTDIWHKKLGHFNLIVVQKLISAEAVRGMPKLQIKDNTLCGPCQAGKQIRQSHPKVKDVNNSRKLKLLHMDLMGPCRLKALEKKVCICVC